MIEDFHFKLDEKEKEIAELKEELRRVKEQFMQYRMAVRAKRDKIKEA